jgi:hypothetical protein
VDRFILGERKEWSETILETAREAALSAFALPSELGRFLSLAARGDIDVGVRHLGESTEAIYSVGQQLLWGILGAVSFCVSVVYEGRGELLQQAVSTGVAGLFGLLLLAALVRGGRARRHKRQRSR